MACCGKLVDHDQARKVRTMASGGWDPIPEGLTTGRSCQTDVDGANDDWNPASKRGERESLFDFFSLDFIYYPVSWIMWVWYRLFAFVLGPSTSSPGRCR